MWKCKGCGGSISRKDITKVVFGRWDNLDKEGRGDFIQEELRYTRFGQCTCNNCGAIGNQINDVATWEEQ